jgi:hypothetical protein
MQKIFLKMKILYTHKIISENLAFARFFHQTLQLYLSLSEVVVYITVRCDMHRCVKYAVLLDTVHFLMP